jgi:hypothetical protein
VDEAPTPRPKSDVALAARLLDLRSPEEEFRALVQARMEALARLGKAAGEAGARLDRHGDALARGLELIREARPR